MAEQVLDKKLYVNNDSAKPKTVIIEPWADERILQPGEKCLIAYMTDPRFEEVEIDCGDEAITVHFHTGAIAEFAEIAEK